MKILLKDIYTYIAKFLNVLIIITILYILSY